MNARLDVTGRWTATAPVLDAGGTRLPDQGALLAWDVAVQLLRRDGIRLEGGVDNLLDARPSGWQVALRRTARLGMRFGGGR
jgi:outer membrane receptor protein involved in Fe transport